MRFRRLAMLGMGLVTAVLMVVGSGDAAFGAKARRTTTTTTQLTTSTTTQPTTTTTQPTASTTSTTVAKTGSTTSTTAATVAPTALSQLRPVGSPVLSDAEAATRVRRTTEIRPENATQNQTVPTSGQLTTFNSFTGQWGVCDHLRRKVTGNFRGTTDEIIQWAAWKWGLPEDTVRAAAVSESYWRMSMIGDNGQSFGLLQIKNVAKWHGGTYPLSKDATAFNVDYYAGMVRHYFEGCATWMKSYSFNGYTYAAGDLYGSIGAWFSGDWHSDAAHSYVSSVQRNEANRVWAAAGF